MIIEQINASDVLETLCTGVSVYRMNVNKEVIINLKSMSISTIINNLTKDDYVYFTVKVSE